MATPEKDIERVQKNLDYVQDELLKRMNAFFGDANLGKNTDDLVRQLKEWKLNIQKENSELKKRQRLVELATKEEQDRLNNLKVLNQESKKPGFLKNFFSLNSLRSSGENSFEEMIRSRQRVQGLGDIFSGNIMSGIRQLGTSFKGLSKFMSGPYYAALELSVKKLLEFDNALTKATKTSAMMAGGITSSAGTSDSYSRIDKKLDEKIMKYPLYQIGMQGRFDEYSKFISQNFGVASLRGIQNKTGLYRTLGMAEYGLGSAGISPDSALSLVSNLRTLEGKNEVGIYAQLQRLLLRSKESSVFSPQQALQQATSLYDQTKHLGINFEWASKTIQSFEKELKKGTITLSDFAAVNRALRSGGISKNAGIAAMVVDYASRSGIGLPSEFLSSNALGQGFGISTEMMLKNNKFATAYQGTIQEQLNQIGGSTKMERAGALQYLLGQYGINIGPEMALKAIKSNGQIDLIGQGIIGSKAFENQLTEAEQATKYQEEIKNFYKNTESYQKTIADTLSMFFSYYKSDTLSHNIQDNAKKAEIEQWRAFASGVTEYKGTVYRGTRQEAQEIFAKLVIGANQ